MWITSWWKYPMIWVTIISESWMSCIIETAQTITAWVFSCVYEQKAKQVNLELFRAFLQIQGYSRDSTNNLGTFPRKLLILGLHMRSGNCTWGSGMFGHLNLCFFSLFHFTSVLLFVHIICFQVFSLISIKNWFHVSWYFNGSGEDCLRLTKLACLK